MKYVNFDELSPILQQQCIDAFGHPCGVLHKDKYNNGKTPSEKGILSKTFAFDKRLQHPDDIDCNEKQYELTTEAPFYSKAYQLSSENKLNQRFRDRLTRMCQVLGCRVPSRNRVGKLKLDYLELQVLNV